MAVRLSAWVAALALLGAGEAAVGQEVPVALLPSPGSQVRAEYRAPTDPVSVEGLFLSGTSRGISLDTDTGPREIPGDLLIGLEVSNGRNRGRGLLVGLGSGLVIGALAVGIYTGATYDESDSCFLVCSRAGAVTLGLATGAAFGAPAGAVIGFAAAPRRWERVW
jgi:hypothetical protein